MLQPISGLPARIRTQISRTSDERSPGRTRWWGGSRSGCPWRTRALKTTPPLSLSSHESAAASPLTHAPLLRPSTPARTSPRPRPRSPSRPRTPSSPRQFTMGISGWTQNHWHKSGGATWLKRRPVGTGHGTQVIDVPGRRLHAVGAAEPLKCRPAVAFRPGARHRADTAHGKPAEQTVSSWATFGS